MQFFDGKAVAESLPWPALLAAIEQIMSNDLAVAPERTVASIPVPDGDDASLLLKPGWVIGDVIAVKAVTFFPENGSHGLPTVNAGVLLFDGTTGVFRGACDGNELTTRRTAAASAVAAKRLARTDVRRLLVVGTGALSPMTAQAHAAVRSYEHIEIWGRSSEKAAAVVAALDPASVGNAQVAVASDLDAAVAEAEVITCVTGSTEPLVLGEHVQAGTHIDLIGAFTPAMRETDDALIARASVWVDTYEDGVLAGDLAQPLHAGVIRTDDLQGDLRSLVTGPTMARTADDQITLFKSAGIALEDVAAARLVFNP